MLSGHCSSREIKCQKKATPKLVSFRFSFFRRPFHEIAPESTLCGSKVHLVYRNPKPDKYKVKLGKGHKSPFYAINILSTRPQVYFKTTRFIPCISKLVNITGYKVIRKKVILFVIMCSSAQHADHVSVF